MARSDPAHPAHSRGAHSVHERHEVSAQGERRDDHPAQRVMSGAPHTHRTGHQPPSRPPVSTFSAQSSLISTPIPSAFSLLSASVQPTRSHAPSLPATPTGVNRSVTAPGVRRFSVPAPINAIKAASGGTATARHTPTPHLRPQYGSSSVASRATMRSSSRFPSPRFTPRSGFAARQAQEITLPSGMTFEQRAQAMKDFPANLEWPANFDDWMIDIVRRRALRLNGGARRRGSLGSVRAVDLALILQRSADAEGRWRCAICRTPMTLNDLSFDHIVALADGGEHAAYNLAPTHRKCNEAKGSEKAQFREQARERWLSEWATTHSGAAPRAASHRLPPSPTRQRRYA